MFSPLSEQREVLAQNIKLWASPPENKTEV